MDEELRDEELRGGTLLGLGLPLPMRTVHGRTGIILHRAARLSQIRSPTSEVDVVPPISGVIAPARNAA